MRCAWSAVFALVTACGFEVAPGVTGDGGPGTDASSDTPGPDALDPDAAVDGPIVPPPDTDGDGIADADDNCAEATNADQADEDADAVGDVCDNCPHVANADQANAGETANNQAADGVGDACDPEPDETGQEIALFLPFNAPAEIATWQAAGTNAEFVVAGGRLEQRGATDLAILWKNDLDFADAWITTQVSYLTIDNTEQFRGASVMTRFVRTTTFGHGVGCGEIRDSQANNGAAFYSAMRFDNGGFQHQIAVTGATVAAGHTATYQVHRSTGNLYECRVGPSTSYSRTLGLTETDGTGINLAVWGVTAAFAYLVVID